MFHLKKRGKDIPITRNSIRSTVNFKMFFFSFPPKAFRVICFGPQRSWCGQLARVDRTVEWFTVTVRPRVDVLQ